LLRKHFREVSRRRGTDNKPLECTGLQKYLAPA
jgi:hypothetical protein